MRAVTQAGSGMKMKGGGMPSVMALLPEYFYTTAATIFLPNGGVATSASPLSSGWSF